MDTSNIYKILANDSKSKRFFIDVFARDEFVEFLKRSRKSHQTQSICVFNTHESNKPGEHWILYAQRDGIGYYFDSYGRSPLHYPDVAKAMTKTFVRKVLWNDRQLQGLTTTVCGDYCVLTSLLLSRGWTFDRIIQRFMENDTFEKRDHSVRATVIALYGKHSISSLTKRRTDLIGRHKLHVKPAVKAIHYLSSLTNFR